MMPDQDKQFGPCAQCVHFRRVKPASQLLASVMQNATSGAEVTNALAKIVDDEQKLREAEADIKAKEGSADRDSWPTRPMMSEYCGLREVDDIFFIHEVKNRGMRCPHFQQGVPGGHSCTDCAHRTASAGRARDQALEGTYNRLINSAIVAQASPQSPQGALQSHRAGAVARQALEIAGAYAAKGWMAAKPEYLDYCSQFSREDEYVVCVLRNPYHTCAAWGAVSESNSGKGSR